MNKKRNYAVNLLKFIAIICVILIHDKVPGNIGGIIRGIAAMAVPVFFMISGYYSYEVTGEILGKRAKRIFFLMLIANAIYFVWDICVELLTGNSLQLWFLDNCSAKRIAVWILLNESSLRGHLWFLGALLYAYLFLYFVIKLHESGKIPEKIWRKHETYLVGIAGILLFGNIIGGEVLTQLGKNIQIPYIRNWLFCGIPFLLVGYWLHGFVARRQGKISTFKVSVMLFVAIICNVAEVILVKTCELYFTTIFVAVFAFQIGEMRRVTKSKIVLFLGDIADKYGLWIYILQIMVIKTIQRGENILGWTDNILIQWISPGVSLCATGILAMLPVWLSGLYRKKK